MCETRRPCQASCARLRLLTLVEQGVLRPEQVQPPLTGEEHAWIAAGPTRLLAEACADAAARAVRGPSAPLGVNSREVVG
jgi:hypothetical protein